VVGDIHGCFDQLRAALDHHGFDSGKDRLFSVGDVIDRGPQSERVLEWLDQPWFHACRGNHEAIYLELLRDPETAMEWLLFNGGEWWLTVVEKKREKILSLFARLPLAMEIRTRWGVLGVVHADVPAGTTWPRFVRALSAGNTDAIETALSSRLRANGVTRCPVEGIDRVVCGHTIMAGGEPHHAANVWFLDTGPYLEDGIGKLTVLPASRIFLG
jgi:Calcineurin-like phosphoesterase